MKMSNELAQQFEFDKKMALLKSIQEKTDYQAQALSAAEVSQEALKKIAAYSGNIKKVKLIGDAVVGVGEKADDFHDTLKNEDISHGFHFASLAVAAINFFRIPMMYFAAYLLHQKIPFTLSNNSRWLYSAVLMGLTITSIAAPATAPIIGFVAASMAFVASSFLLGKLIYERSKLAREEKLLQKKILVAEDEMELIHEEAQQLEQHLKEAKTEQEAIDVSLEIALLHERYSNHSKFLEKLYDKKLHIEQIKEELGFKKVVFKSVSLLLASAAVIGLVVSIFFPPAGLAIVATVAVTGATFMAARVLTPLLRAFGRWIANKTNPHPKPEEPIDEKREENHPHEESSLLQQKQEVLQQENQRQDADDQLMSQAFPESTSEVIACLSSVASLSENHSSENHSKVDIEVPPIICHTQLFSKPPSSSLSSAPQPSSVSLGEEEEGEGENFENH